MNGSLLLFYLSEVGNGKWTRFTDALEVVDARWGHSTHARQLSMLGHVEFDFWHKPRIRWAICQPTLAWLPERNVKRHRAVLCGLRTEPFLETLRYHAAVLDCALEIVPQRHNPDAIFVQAGEQYQLNQLAEAMQFANEPQSAERLAECIPHLNAYRHLCETRPEPQGYGIRYFDGQSLRWVEVEKSAENGLYEYMMVDGSRTYCYKKEYVFTKVPRDMGLYMWLADERRQILQYDTIAQTLTVPRFAVLPTLLARAATLCSGLLPKLVENTFVYQNTPAPVAYNIMIKLNQVVMA